MGKSKKRSRASHARANPLGSSKINARDNSSVANKIVPLLKNLESAVPNDRAMALASISVLCEDPNMRKMLLKEKLVHIILTKLLSDDNTDIVVESYGLLRNLSLEEGYDVSVYLWRSDIWTSISQGFQNLLNSLSALEKSGSSGNKVSTESKRLLFDYADNLLSLVVALANGSDDIMSEVLGAEKLNQLFLVMMRLLQYGLDKLPSTVLNTILDVIYDFSSESFEFIEAVSKHEFLAGFVKGLPNQMNAKCFNELSKVLIQGIFLQFLDMDISYEQANSIIHETWNSIKHIDMEEVNTVLSNQSQDEELIKSEDSKVAEKIKDFSKARADAMMKLQGIEIAIDLLTAIIEIIASLYESGMKNLPQDLGDTISKFLPEIFESLGVTFSSRILIAWNNLLWLYLTLDMNFFEFPNEPYVKLWEFINHSPDTTVDVRIGKLSVTWALLKSIGSQSDQAHWLTFFNLQNNLTFAKSIINKYEEDLTNKELSKEDFIELGQKYCGVLSSYAMFQGQIDINGLIGQFVLKQLVSKDTPPVLLMEFTNSLFEVYGDGDYDYDKPIFVQGGFLEIIQNKVIPNLKSQFKFVDKNKDPQLRAKCNECASTLESFIHYKRNE